MDTATIPKVVKDQSLYRGKSADDQEKYEFYAKLRMGDFSKRDLTDAVAGVIFASPPVLQEIFAMRYELSLIDRLGIKRHPTSNLITNVASEVTGHAVQPAIAEAAAHIANEPAFVMNAVTVLKYGSLVTCTEELLEDQALFQSWFPKALGRQLSLQENAILYARLAASGTLGFHLTVADTLTEAGLSAFYTAMPGAWREGAKIVTSTETMLAMRSLLIATPRAYPPPDWASQQEQQYQAMWMGMPMFLNVNWPTLAVAADAVEVITMVNPEGVIFVERHGMEIVRDEYGAAATGHVRFMCNARFEIVCPIPLAVVHLTDHV